MNKIMINKIIMNEFSSKIQEINELEGANMTIENLLDLLDGWGIVYEDEALVIERLSDIGCSLFDTITISKPDGTVVVGKKEE